MSVERNRGVTPQDIARVEAWASASLPGRDEGVNVVVRGRGSHIQVEEQREGASGSVTSRTIVRFRFVEKADSWVVHRAAAGGRWIGRDAPHGTLAEVLEAVDLRNIPS